MSFLLRRLGPAAIVAVFASVALESGSAQAFCRTTTTPIPASYNPRNGCFTEGLLLFWRNACVSYSLDKKASTQVTSAQFATVMEQAFGTWTSSACDSGPVGIQVSATEPVTCNEVRYNQNGPNQNVITFRDEGWPYNDPNNTLGLTTVTFNADTGDIYDADMEINSFGQKLTVDGTVPSNGFDLLSVVTHEAGHFLGLAHATDSQATMYAAYKPGSTSLRTLTPDDIAGLCAIYPDREHARLERYRGEGRRRGGRVRPDAEAWLRRRLRGEPGAEREPFGLRDGR